MAKIKLKSVAQVYQAASKKDKVLDSDVVKLLKAYKKDPKLKKLEALKRERNDFIIYNYLKPLRAKFLRDNVSLRAGRLYKVKGRKGKGLFFKIKRFYVRTLFQGLLVEASGVWVDGTGTPCKPAECLIVYGTGNPHILTEVKKK